MTLRNTLFIASLTLLPLTTQAADEADTVNFVVPPWPGVTVKTEIVARLIDDLGYQANRIDMSSTVGYSTLQSGDTAVFLGG